MSIVYSIIRGIQTGAYELPKAVVAHDNIMLLLKQNLYNRAFFVQHSLDGKC